MLKRFETDTNVEMNAVKKIRFTEVLCGGRGVPLWSSGLGRKTI